jgi:hypothetical protein
MTYHSMCSDAIVSMFYSNSVGTMVALLRRNYQTWAWLSELGTLPPGCLAKEFTFKGDSR